MVRIRMRVKSVIMWYFQWIDKVYGWIVAAVAQLGERQTEDLKVSGSIPDCGNISFYPYMSTASPESVHHFSTIFYYFSIMFYFSSFIQFTILSLHAS